MHNNKLKPPVLAQRLLSWFLREELTEEVMGDLDEQFYKTTKNQPLYKAKLNYWYQVFHYLRPFAIKNYRSNSNYFIMYTHNIKVTYRSFLRDKTSFFINLIGLTCGLASALLIFLWVTDELSVDKFHEKGDQLYQVFLNHEESDQLRTGPGTQGILARALEEEAPEIIMAVEDTDPKWFDENFSLSVEGQIIRGKGKFSGKDYFKLFSFPLKSGSPQQVLQDKKGIVISESMALKLFDRIDVVGETVSWNLLHVNGEATVTGVFEDLPHNTTEEFDFILPFEQFAQILGSDMNWGNYNAYTYVRLAPNTNVEALNKKLKDFVKRKREGSNVNVFVTKYADYYLYDKYENGKQAGGRILYVKLFSAIGIFILIIASINFMNLTTAKASRRLKEIGVKKSMGASRTSLITQFMTESIFISLIALILATQVVFLVLPAFNGLTGKHLALMLNSDLVLSFLAIALITGLLAGSYPAFYLSGFKPVRILKGKLTSTFGEAWIRKGLVIFQFTLSIIMIVSVIVVYKQIDYIQNKNLGYDRENVITVPIEGEAVKKLDTFLKEISSLPGVVNASATSHTFIKTTASTTGVDWPGKDPDISVLFEQARAHYGLTKTLGIEFIEGRGFSRDYKNEDSKIIFNEAAIEVMGLKDPIGKKVVMWGDEKEIIGVVKNFNYASLHHEVKPMLLHFNTEFLPVAMIRIKSGNIGEAIDQMESFYQSFNPGYTFDYEFMDKSYRAQYQAESQISTLSQVFAGIAILISCLGLFGLATYTAERRQKEIGIRKVLGAGNVRIVTLLSNDFTKMVVIAILLAIPASYYFSTQWLDGYAYRIALKYEYFIVASVLSLSIAWLTVSYQILRAASINPVESLKDE